MGMMTSEAVAGVSDRVWSDLFSRFKRSSAIRNLIACRRSSGLDIGHGGASTRVTGVGCVGFLMRKYFVHQGKLVDHFCLKHVALQ